MQKCGNFGEGEKLLHGIVCPQVFKKRGQEQLFSFLARMSGGMWNFKAADKVKGKAEQLEIW